MSKKRNPYLNKNEAKAWGELLKDEGKAWGRAGAHVLSELTGQKPTKRQVMRVTSNTRKPRRKDHPLDSLLQIEAENISDDAEDHRNCFDYIYDQLVEWAEEREPEDIAIAQIRREAEKYFQEYMARYEE